MVSHESQYLQVLEELHHQGRLGRLHGNRTGVRTASIFGGVHLRADLSRGNQFPLLTTKKVHFKSVAEELFWFLRGDTNVRSLQAKGVTIWDEWADEEGELGPIYGAQWREWCCEHDQLLEAERQIREEPESRRILISSWNVGELSIMALPPCHLLSQFRVDPYDQRLHLQVYQRSADWFLGVPFNLASYALFLVLMAHRTGLQPGRLCLTFGDVHLYENHLDAARKQLRRRRKTAPPPTLGWVAGRDWPGWDHLSLDDVWLIGYDPLPAIKAEVAV